MEALPQEAPLLLISLIKIKKSSSDAGFDFLCSKYYEKMQVSFHRNNSYLTFAISIPILSFNSNKSIISIEQRIALINSLFASNCNQYEFSNESMELWTRLLEFAQAEATTAAKTILYSSVFCKLLPQLLLVVMNDENSIASSYRADQSELLFLLFETLKHQIDLVHYKHLFENFSLTLLLPFMIELSKENASNLFPVIAEIVRSCEHKFAPMLLNNNHRQYNNEENIDFQLHHNVIDLLSTLLVYQWKLITNYSSQGLLLLFLQIILNEILEAETKTNPKIREVIISVEELQRKHKLFEKVLF